MNKTLVLLGEETRHIIYRNWKAGVMEFVGSQEPCAETKGMHYEIWRHNGTVYAMVVAFGCLSCVHEIEESEISQYI